MLNLQYRKQNFNPKGEMKSLIQNIQNQIVNLIEMRVFGICSWLGDKLGMKASNIRIYFVYLSFFTFGSPIIIYLILAFLRENKHYFFGKKVRSNSSVWDF